MDVANRRPGVDGALREAPDATAAELCWEYNCRVDASRRTSVAAIGRARRRLGFVCKKTPAAK
jgi:hypothetical protein